jgi:RNA polymerase sigma-70 factor (ECF subfamily)
MEAPEKSEGSRMPEAEAIRRAQQGDAAAFEYLYRTHSRKVYFLCLQMAGNSADAEDLTQDAFLQSFRKIRMFRGDSAFSTWLHRLTVNIVLMRFRKKKIATSSLDEVTEADDESGSPGLQIGERDLRLAGVIDRLNLTRALAELPAGYRAMFILRNIQGYTHEEIARMLECSVGNSKSQLHKARLRLREILQKSPRSNSHQKQRSERRRVLIGNRGRARMSVFPATAPRISRPHNPSTSRVIERERSAHEKEVRHAAA